MLAAAKSKCLSRGCTASHRCMHIWRWSEQHHVRAIASRSTATTASQPAHQVRILLAHPGQGLGQDRQQIPGAWGPSQSSGHDHLPCNEFCEFCVVPRLHHHDAIWPTNQVETPAPTTDLHGQDRGTIVCRSPLRGAIAEAQTNPNSE